jgi:hypothetical protein
VQNRCPIACTQIDDGAPVAADQLVDLADVHLSEPPPDDPSHGAHIIRDGMKCQFS